MTHMGFTVSHYRNMTLKRPADKVNHIYAQFKNHIV